MAMLPFLPWATISEPAQFGQFHLSPTGSSLVDETMTAEHRTAIRMILEAYDKRRQIDQDRVPLLRRADLGITAELDDEQVADYFDFRTRLA